MEFVKNKFCSCILFLDSNRGYYVLKLTFAILGSMAGLFIAGGFLLCLITHRLRRKDSMAPHQNELMIDPDIEPSMLHFSFPSSVPSASYHPPELRATAAGDSTLKVCNNISLYLL